MKLVDVVAFAAVDIDEESVDYRLVLAESSWVVNVKSTQPSGPL